MIQSKYGIMRGVGLGLLLAIGLSMVIVFSSGSSEVFIYNNF